MRYFIELSYNGTEFHGWQRQPNATSVQQTIEEAMQKILRTPTLTITGAGRTDTGVHASKMIAHFDIEQELSDTPTLINRLNSLLPPSISIKSIVEVAADAHARFDATYRTYHYYVTTQKDPFMGQFRHRQFGTLNIEAMNQAAQQLFNYTDFTSFSKLHTDVATNNCKIMAAHWEEVDGGWRFVVTADRFLRNMVRAIVGTLMEVGRGKITITEFCQVIEAKNRNMAGTSMPARALFLVDIGYPMGS